MPELEQVRIVAQSQISDLASEAETAPRRRTHLLLHSGPQDQVQRLMIVLQPGTYIRPHHHSEQWELVVLLQGRGDLLRFDGSGCLADRIELSTRAQVAQIPVEKRLLVTNHEALGYFAERYGFTIVGAIVPSITSGAAPSAQELAALILSLIHI